VRALLRHCEANPRRGVRRAARRGARRGAARRATCEQFAAALPSIDRIEAAAHPLAHPASPALAASPASPDYGAGGVCGVRGMRGVESNADGLPPGAGGDAELIAGGDEEGDEEEAEEGGEEEGEEDEGEEGEEEEELDEEEELQLLGAFFTGVRCAAAPLCAPLRPSAPLHLYTPCLHPCTPPAPSCTPSTPPGHPRTIPRRLLFEMGALPLLPPLVALLEPVRRRVVGLQRSAIHIEHAYYCYIAQLLLTYQLPRTPRPPPPPHLPNLPNLPNLPHLPHLPPIFLVGDSHALAASWRVVQWRGAARLLRPVSVTGLKAWHLRPASDFYTSSSFDAALLRLPQGASLIALLGQIDCREGLLPAVERARYEGLAEASPNPNPNPNPSALPQPNPHPNPPA
jgi:hypothetical protein